MASKPYHHGDLREALLSEALAMLEDRKTEDLSLREIARKVGVSPGAVYRHFTDKDDLLRELAGRGLDRLASSQRDAWNGAGGGVAGFAATGRAYVRFAIEQPTIFRLIFSRSEVRAEGAPSGRMSEAMAFLISNAVDLAPAGSDASTFALRSWSLVHGLAMLILDGHVEPDTRVIDAVVESARTACGE